MARQLKLVRLDDFIADIDSLDLLSGGFALAKDGYYPVAANDGDKSVVETITLNIQGTSQDDVASKLHSLDDKVKQIVWWRNDPGVERYQVWLRVQLDNEYLPRQAMILDIKSAPKVKVFTPEEYNGNWLGEYQLGIERTPWGEAPYPYPTTTAKTGINSIGGTATLSETIRGDVPARLAKLYLYPPDATSPMSDYWIGWKTNRFGVAANFQPVWSVGDYAGLLSGDTTQVADGTAYGTNKIQCTFASGATLLPRCVNQLGATTGTDADQRGSYAVLLRAKMSDTSVARVRLESGFMPGTTLYNPAVKSRQVISGTSWRLYEMGTIDIPPSRIYSTNTLTDVAIQLDAERISGAGNLDMDCLILIPIDDGMVKLSAPIGTATTGQSVRVFQSADDTVKAFFEEGGNVEYTVIAKPTNGWSLPANDDSPIVVIASQDVTAGCVKGKTVSMAYTYIPRWRTLRGTET